MSAPAFTPVSTCHDSPDVGASGAPGPLITFYAMGGNNSSLPPSPGYGPLDVAYLGTVMLEVVGLPLSAAQRYGPNLPLAAASVL